MSKQGIFDPCNIIGEVLGVPADEMRNPVNADYCCPYLNSTCVKRSQRIEGPFPVCSIYKSANPTTENLVCVCPKRFFDIDLKRDVIENCWVGEKPTNARIVTEVKMSNLGMVDLVVADFSSDCRTVKDFISVELQSIDITGSYEPAYTALTLSKLLDKKPTYGFNWANVRKRYITQLIQKGFFHHQWKTRIVSVLQDHVFNRFQADLDFDSIEISKADIVFLVYSFKKNDDGNFELALSNVVGTSHNSLMMKVLYQSPPSKDAFCKTIVARV